MYKVLFILRESNHNGHIAVAMHVEDFKTAAIAEVAIANTEQYRKDGGTQVKAVKLW